MHLSNAEISSTLLNPGTAGSFQESVDLVKKAQEK